MSRQVIGMALGTLLLVGAPSGAATGQVMEPPDQTVTSVVLDPGDEPLANLRYAWTAGEVESLSLELWDHEVGRFGDRVVEDHLPVPFRVEASVTVERVDADGSALVLTTVEDVELLGDPVGGDGHKLAVDVATLDGVRIRSKLNDQGYVIASAVFDPEAAGHERHPARASALDLLEHPVVRLPFEPMGVNGVWQETVTTTDGELTGTETHVKSLSDIEASGRLLVESSTVVDLPAQELPGEGFGLDTSVTGSGSGQSSSSARVDLSRVVPLTSLERSAAMEVRLPVGEGATIAVEKTTAAVLAPGASGDDPRPVLAEPPVRAARVASDEQGGVESPSGSIDVVVLDPGAEPRWVLRYQPQEGLQERSVVTTSSGVRTKVEGEWTTWVGIPRTEMAMTSTVMGVRDDGSFDVEVVYTDVRVLPGSGQVTPQASEELQAQLAGFVGTRQTLHVDDRGRVLAARTILPAAADPSLQPGLFDALERELVDPLPVEPVGPGAVWEVERETTDAMGFTASGFTTTTLTAVLADGRLQLEGELWLSADPGPMSIPDMEFVDATLERFSTEGEFSKTVDLESFHPVGSARGVGDYAITVVFGDVTETTEMQMSMESEFSLVDDTSLSDVGWVEVARLRTAGICRSR